MEMTSKLNTTSKVKTTSNKGEKLASPPKNMCIIPEKLLTTFHLDNYAITDFQPEILSGVKQKIEFHILNETYTALHTAHIQSFT